MTSCVSLPHPQSGCLCCRRYCKAFWMACPSFRALVSHATVVAAAGVVVVGGLVTIVVGASVSGSRIFKWIWAWCIEYNDNFIRGKPCLSCRCSRLHFPFLSSLVTWWRRWRYQHVSSLKRQLSDRGQLRPKFYWIGKHSEMAGWLCLMPWMMMLLYSFGGFTKLLIKVLNRKLQCKAQFRVGRNPVQVKLHCRVRHRSSFQLTSLAEDNSDRPEQPAYVGDVAVHVGDLKKRMFFWKILFSIRKA